MSLHMWAPLGRLTYCAYLIELNITDIIMKSQKTSLYANSSNIIQTTIAITVITYFFALPFCLFIEIPLHNFLGEKLKTKARVKHLEIGKLAFKILFLGNSEVGKSSIVNQYVNKHFSINHKDSSGAELSAKNIYIDDELITLNI